MQIDIERNIVKFSSESAGEQAKLEELWKTLIDCAGTSRKLAPIGEYVPAKNKCSATFFIEGMNDEKTYTRITVENDCRCYCDTCNNFVDIRRGDAIPICCGKLMEIVE